MILLWLLSTAIEFDAPVTDPRPIGTLEDIEALAAREDLNVLFVLIDTLRADRMGMYGYERDTTPVLDGLAATGVRFDRHLAQSSWTKSSMASMWSGFYPPRTGITRYDHVVPEVATMPAERFREAGFRTIGLFRNGWVAPTFGFEQGFDVYTRPPRIMMDPSIRRENPTLSTVGTDEDTTAAAVEFLRVSGGDGRWFLYVHLMDVHEYLYDEESAIFGGAYPDKYDASVRWTDGTLARFFANLWSFGLGENTLVVIGSDHGEAFRERGIEGHARALYRESTEVPFVILFPFRLETGVVIRNRTQNVDVWPTVFELIGLDAPEGLDGISRVPEILASVRGDAEMPPDATTGVAFLDESWGRRNAGPRERIAITEGSYRYLRNPARHGEIGHVEELFDADRDPRELEEISGEEPDLVERLRAEAEAELGADPVWGEAPTRELDEFELNQLRALGYAIP